MSGESPPLEFGILGPLEAAIGGRPVEIRGAKQRTLLALLLVHRGEAVPVATIIDELWPEAPPSTAQQSVQMHVSRLRRALVDAGDRDALRTSGAGYRIDVAADAVDANRFDRVLAHAEREKSRRPAEARARFDAALALWRGEALADVPRGARLGAEAARLEERRLAARVERAACLLELGDLSTATAELETLARLHPLQERVRMLLMEALARSGRKADALAVFRDARRTLVEEVGIEPSGELRDLHERLLRDEPLRTRVPHTTTVASAAAAESAPEPREAEHRRVPRAAGAAAVVVLALAGAIALVAGALNRTARGLPSISPEAVGVVDPHTGRIERQLAFGGRPL